MSPMYNATPTYKPQHLTPSPQPNSPLNNFNNPSNTPSPYGYDRLSPSGSMYNPTPSPQPQPPVQNQQYLQTYNFQNNLNSPYHSMPGSVDPAADFLNNDQYGYMQYNNLNVVTNPQMHHEQSSPNGAQNIDPNLNIMDDSEGLKTSDLMDIDSGQLLKLNSTEIMSNLSLS